MKQVYVLKLASKTLQKIILLSVLLLPIAFLIDFVINDFSMPTNLSALSQPLLLCSVIIPMCLLPFFLFYRQKVEVFMDERGVVLPFYGLITWKSIRWYRFDLFSSTNGIRGLTLHYGAGKAVLLASDNESLMLVEEAIKQNLKIHNPKAKDFRELKSSRMKAYLLITFFTLLHLTISWMLDFEKKYIWIATPVLLITIGAILLDFIKKPAQ